jgi:S1-C subfamily serine protease
MNEQRPDGETPLINMSVPIELLPPILEDLSHGQLVRAPRPWLGVISQEVGSHVVVADVSAGGPAARAELRRGDVVLAVGGERVASLAEFYTRLWALGPAGVVAPLRLRREEDIFEVEIRTADRSSRLRKRRLN